MNIIEALMADSSKKQVKHIAHFIGEDVQHVATLMECFFADNWRLNQRAAAVVSEIADQSPQLIRPYIGQMINNLDAPKHVAVKRNTVRVLQFQEIPEETQGKLIDHCFGYLQKAGEPVAIKAFSMGILANLVGRYPELKKELQFMIEEQLPYGSPAFQSRGKKVLKQLAQQNHKKT